MDNCGFCDDCEEEGGFLYEGENDEVCDCGQRASDYCGFCGKPLCFMCFEMGAGFCNGPHTREQIEDYARQVYGR